MNIGDKVKVKFVNIDSWNRPIFKATQGNYYGSTSILVPYGESEKEVLKRVLAEDLTYFGRRFDCEPMGTKPKHTLEIKGGLKCV